MPRIFDRSDSHGPSNILFGAAALFFYTWLMLLPLVGRSGAATPHATANLLTSFAVLLVSGACSVGGVLCLRENASRLPCIVRFLCVLQGLALLFLATGLLKM